MRLILEMVTVTDGRRQYEVLADVRVAKSNVLRLTVRDDNDPRPLAVVPFTLQDRWVQVAPWTEEDIETGEIVEEEL